MNHMKINDTMRLFAVHSLNAGIPQKIVCEIIGVSAATLTKRIADIPKLKKGERYAMMLKLYVSIRGARFKADEKVFNILLEQADVSNADVSELRNYCSLVLEKLHLFLQMESLELYYRGIMDGKEIVEKSHFAPAVDESHQRLFRAMYGDNLFYNSHRGSSENIIHPLIELLGDSETNELQKSPDPIQVMKRILRDLSRDLDEVGMIFESDAVKELDTKIENLTDRRKEIIKRFYGIETGKSESLDDIGKSMNLTRERVRQLKDSTTRRLRYGSSYSIKAYEIIPFHLEKRKSEDANKERIASLGAQIADMRNVLGKLSLKDNLPVDISSEIQRILGGNDYKRTPIEDLDISVRAYNCAKAAKINYLEELCNYTYAELIRLRNFGRKSLAELQELMIERGLSLKPE